MRVLAALVLLGFAQNGFAQNDRDLPFTIALEQFAIPDAPALHSFAFAKTEGKWLIVCGRTNGLHGFNIATGFPANAANDKLWVIDPHERKTWSSNLSSLPNEIADQLRSTNPQWYQSGARLYVAGGYGNDSAQGRMVSLGKLLALDVPGIVQAVIDNQSVRPFIRQIEDARLQVTGGEMKKLGEDFYLVFGHNFNGLYSRNEGPTFTQAYTNEIRKFRIEDDGVNLRLTNYSAISDPTLDEFHRRDLNVAPLVRPDGALELAAYGGVFRREADLPYLHPIYINASGARIDSSYEQLMSHYTCANMGIFDNARHAMYTTFFGGISLHYFDEQSGTLERNELVPFIDEITSLARFADGSSFETIHPVRMPGLLGSNAIFILDESVPSYENEVIKLEEISTRTFAGYIFGGIKAVIPNITPSSASDVILKVYITPAAPQAVAEGPRENGYELSVAYPNPMLSRSQINLRLQRSQHVTVEVFDLLGQSLAVLHKGMLPAHQTQSFVFAATHEVKGLVFFCVTGEDFGVTRKVLLLK